MAPTPEAWRRRLANAVDQRRVDSKILAGPRRESEGLVESGMGRRGHGGIGRLSGQKVAGRKTVGFKSTCPHPHSVLWCKYSDFGSVGRGTKVLGTQRGGEVDHNKVYVQAVPAGDGQACTIFTAQLLRLLKASGAQTHSRRINEVLRK